MSCGEKFQHLSSIGPILVYPYLIRSRIKKTYGLSRIGKKYSPMPHAQTWRYIEDDDGESHRKFHLVVEKFEYSVKWRCYIHDI
jgi:hypothetical protein